MSRRGLARVLAGACALICLAVPAAAGAATLPAGFEEQDLVTGLTRPMSVAWTPDGRMLIAEKDGRLKLVQPGTSVATTILDISQEVNSTDDRGLLGLAVDSSFASNHFIYLLYTYDAYIMKDTTQPATSRLTRYVLSDTNQLSGKTDLLGSYPTAPCPAPDNAVDCIPSDGSTHSIGTVHSAPDGTLYVGSGDGAGFASRDQLAFRSFDPRSMAGKILHVDRNGNGVTSNSFCNQPVTSVCRKVHAAGFRNPFRFALMPDGTSLSVGDVGWFQYEEVSLIRSTGGSYGWPCYEGTHRTTDYEADQKCIDLYAAETAGTRTPERAPFHDYFHSAMSSAAMGGPVYEGNAYPADHQGALFVSDYGAGFIKYFKRNGAGDPVGAPIDFASGWLGVEVDTHPANGDLVYVSPGDFLDGSGSIVRIAYSPGNATPVAAASANPSFGPAPLQVSFSAAGSTDPDGDTLGYSWDFGDGSTDSTQQNPQHTYNANGTYFATLTVDDGRGRTDTATVRVDVGNSPPVVQLDLPVDESTYRVGGAIQLQGSASDPDPGDSATLQWTLRLVHGSHLHPGPVVTGATGSFNAATDHDADSHYEVTLTATDSKGLSASKTVQVRPETVGFSIKSDPPGAPVTYAGLGLVAPVTFPAAVDFRTSVSAAQSFVRNGSTYTFKSWSNAGERAQTVTVPAGGLELVASYAGPGGGGPGGTGPGGDGPVLRFDRERGLVARRGLVRGVVVDEDGIARVSVALALRAGSRCRWWNASTHRPSRPLSCKRPRWLRARLGKPSGARRSWQVRLGRKAPAGRYLLEVRGTDRTGDVTTRTFKARVPR